MRLHSYPDSVSLIGPMGARFKQVGNSVPPMLAEALGRGLAAAVASG